MIKVVSLPYDVSPTGGQAFPIPNDFRHVFLMGKSGNEVQMVGHEQKQVQDPLSAGVIEDAVFEQRGRDGWQTKLVSATRLAANGEEKPKTTRHKRGWAMLQGFA